MSRVNCLCPVFLPELGIVPRYFEQLFDSPLVQMGIKVIFNPGFLFGIARYLLMNPLLLVPGHLHKPLQQEKPVADFACSRCRPLTLLIGEYQRRSWATLPSLVDNIDSTVTAAMI